MSETHSNKERLKNITDSIEKGIQDLFQSDRYAQYLRTMSRFHRYSLNNTMLIYLQKPDATLVAGFNKWHDQFGRNVMKGEKGIKIIAPTPFKKKVERERLDPDTHLPMLDADGKVITEEKEIQIPMFRPITVFDISQTQGRPLPQLAADLTGNVENYEVFMEALAKASPVPIYIRPISGGADGFFSREDQSITIREGMSEKQTVSAVVHEIAHSKLHNYPTAEEDAPQQRKSRRTEEVEAESVSYAVCAYYGIPTGENSFGYIASWSEGKELPELKASLETINRTASELITAVDRNYAQIMKARSNERTEPSPQEAAHSPEPRKEPAADADLPLPDPTVTVADMNTFGYTGENMLPLSQARALDLFQRNIPVHLLHEDNTEIMAMDIEEVQQHSGFFGIGRSDWAQAAASIPPLKEELETLKREAAFLEAPGDGYAVYQLRPSEKTAALMFMDSAWLKRQGLVPQHRDYDLVYTGRLGEACSQAEQLENLYCTFNLHRPEDFTGHSLAISDVIVLKQGDSITCHYVDKVGYRPLPDFLSPENDLRNAEMQMEDDPSMLDGVINNGSRQEEKPSVLEKLRSYHTEKEQSTHKCAERSLE